METVKCVLVGDPSVGKSWLITTYITGKNPEGYIPTLFDKSSKEVARDGQTYSITLWDTAGSDEYKNLRGQFLQEADVFLICYAVNSPTSFRNTRAWIEELSKYNVPMILCGTKCDVVDGELVDKAHPETLKNEYNLYASIECSSLELINVNKVFCVALDAVLKTRRSRTESIWLCCCKCI
ncbi:Rho-like GTPase [Ordospora colligata]|uniref:Rho-like GTPase n=1 Tax=Ordospora colligata OC4 TaxID=1354746 RepID=A0A0B2ULT6_9MICR|nr:Rho-like GTPase [Ordospora colligata OC4]KHN70032.1 Rho-like GTPase [Ordospora colligata OC4]TBU16414.1 Rho-like GTPase [Ordospora colligata]TBU16599.1 Rho-like GTPase [Ordospora colligata]TBU19172.1 Rho-like GTPase [Ordospora colligata]